MHFKVNYKINYPDLVLALGTVSLLVVLMILTGLPAYRMMRNRAFLVEIKGNAATLQLAAETYGAAHLGQYPTDPLDLVPYLPGGEPPLNPLTGDRTLFRVVPGDLTYRSPTHGHDYVIEAWGPGPEKLPQRLTILQGHSPRSPQP